MKQTMQSALQSVGVFRHYCGYPHFILAVTIAAENPDRLHVMPSWQMWRRISGPSAM